MEDFSFTVPWQSLAYLSAFMKVFRKNRKAGAGYDHPHISIYREELNRKYSRLFSRDIKNDIYVLRALGFLELKHDQWGGEMFYAVRPETLTSLPACFFESEEAYRKDLHDDWLLSRPVSSIGRLSAEDLARYLVLKNKKVE